MANPFGSSGEVASEEEFDKDIISTQEIYGFLFNIDAPDSFVTQDDFNQFLSYLVDEYGYAPSRKDPNVLEYSADLYAAALEETLAAVVQDLSMVLKFFRDLCTYYFGNVLGGQFTATGTKFPVEGLYSNIPQALLLTYFFSPDKFPDFFIKLMKYNSTPLYTSPESLKNSLSKTSTGLRGSNALLNKPYASNSFVKWAVEILGSLRYGFLSDFLDEDDPLYQEVFDIIQSNLEDEEDDEDVAEDEVEDEDEVIEVG